MNEEAMRQALRECVKLKGKEILADKSRFKGVVHDVLPGLALQNERNLLIIAAENFSLGEELLKAPPHNQAREHIFQLMLQKLSGGGISKNAAAAVLQSFALALEWQIKFTSAKGGSVSIQDPVALQGSCLHGDIDFAAYRCRDCGQTLYGIYNDSGYVPYEKLRKRERDGILASVSDRCVGLLVLPEHITALSDDCLSEQQDLEEVVLPASLRSIGCYAFDACPALKTIRVPDSVTRIGEGAFQGLKRVYYNGPASGSPWGAAQHITSPNTPPTPQPAPKPQPLRPKAFIADKANEAYAYKDNKNLQQVVIPDGVAAVGIWAFRNCGGLSGAALPDSVAAIEDGAFSNCSSLSDITLPNGLKTIGSGAFSNCSSLKSIVIPDSVVSIGSEAFLYCTSLTGITIPNSVKQLGRAHTFAGCSSLRSIALPNGIASIGFQAFEGCSSLTNLTIPNSVKTIGKYAFKNCHNLNSIIFRGKRYTYLAAFDKAAKACGAARDDIY